jgi:predicted nucleic acid-binding protein
LNYLLDTCVLSEFTRRQPDAKVIQWLDSVDEEALYLSSITIGEIQRGVERLTPGRRKIELVAWINDGLIRRFGRRILPLDTPAMLTWGSLTARCENLGRPLPLMDSLIAATALLHSLTIVTRNNDDFSPCSLQIFNPWD